MNGAGELLHGASHRKQTALPSRRSRACRVTEQLDPLQEAIRRHGAGEPSGGFCTPGIPGKPPGPLLDRNQPHPKRQIAAKHLVAQPLSLHRLHPHHRRDQDAAPSSGAAGPEREWCMTYMTGLGRQKNARRRRQPPADRRPGQGDRRRPDVRRRYASSARASLVGALKRSPIAHGIHRRRNSDVIPRRKRCPACASLSAAKTFPAIPACTSRRAHLRPSTASATSGRRSPAVAADTPEIAEKALDLIEVEYEELPGVFDPEFGRQPPTSDHSFI